MVLHGSLSDSNSPQVSRTFLSILADLSNAVTWMVSTCPLISKIFSLFAKLVGIFPNAPITIGINLNFMFNIFSSLKGLKIHLSFRFFLLYHCGPLVRQSSHISRSSLLLLSLLLLLLLLLFIFVCYVSLDISCFYYFLASTFKTKSKKETFTLNIYNIKTISIYRSNFVK